MSRVRAVVWLLMLALAGRVASAQTVDRILAGRVTDELGGVLVKADVVVTTPAGQRIGLASTGPDGTFRLVVSSASEYRVTVHHAAFEDSTLTASLEQVERGDVLDIVLGLGRLVERVSVETVSREQAFAPASPQNPYRLPASAAPVSQVLTSAQIQLLKPASVFDLVNHTTGSFSTSSGKKGFSGARIRGDSNLIWIVDGAYLPSQVAGRILQGLPVGAIEQMEVFRGASSLTLAPMVGFSNPSGAPTDGFVIVRTRRALGDRGSVRVGAEQNATALASALVGRGFGASHVAGTPSLGYLTGSVSFLDTAGPEELLPNGFGYNVARRAASGLVKAGISQGFFNIDVSYFRDHSRFQVPNSSLVAAGSAADNWEMRPSRTDLIATTGTLVWSQKHTTLFAISHNRTHQKLNGAGSVANLNFDDGGLINDNRTTHVNVRQVADVAGMRLSAGGDLMHWHTPTGQNSYEGVERKEHITGLFAQIERSVFRDRLALDASIRRDRVKVIKGLDYFTGGAQSPSPLPLVENRLLAPALFGTAGFRLTAAPSIAITGRVGRNRQNDSNINPVPGLTLEPEVQQKWEAGIEGRFSRAFTATLTGFHRGVSDEKSISGYSYTRANNTAATCVTTTIPTTGALAPATGLQPCYTQSDTARDGVELVVEGGWLTSGRYRAGLTRMTRLADSAGVVQLTTPKQVVDVTVTHGWRALMATASVKRVSRFSGRRPAGGADTTYYPLGDFTRIDASASWSQPTHNALIRFSVYGRNLSDAHSQTVAGYPDVGRVVGTDMTITF